MKTIETILLCVASLYSVILIIVALCSRRPVRFIFLNAVLGTFLLVIINLLSPMLGIHIPVNPYSVGITALGGGGGVFLLLALNLIV